MKLSQCELSDLYVSDDPNNVPVIRSLQYVDEQGRTKLLEGVQQAPNFLLADIRKLFIMILESIKVKPADEIVCEYDGIRYRCARIVAPEGMTIRKKTEAQIWCLRKIATGVRDFSTIQFTPFIQNALTSMGRNRGLLLVCGSFGSGKTTTASSLFSNWVIKNKEVGVTLEDPPEVMMQRMGSDGTIFQIDLTENSTEEAIKKLRRWAPRYVFLGEIRTAEAAQELLQISQSGVMAMATLHASDPVSAITALVRFSAARMSENDARDLIARTLKGVVYQTIENGVFSGRYLSVGLKDDFGVRTKIRLGDFQRIDETLEHQEKNR